MSDVKKKGDKGSMDYCITQFPEDLDPRSRCRSGCTGKEPGRPSSAAFETPDAEVTFNDSLASELLRAEKPLADLRVPFSEMKDRLS